MDLKEAREIMVNLVGEKEEIYDMVLAFDNRITELEAENKKLIVDYKYFEKKEI